jgi:ribosome-associated translation inhibitor RaiA
MNVILEAEEALAPELKAFTENRVKFTLKRLFWMVQKIKVRYSLIAQSKTAFNQHCQISLETFDHRCIEISMTARDRHAALNMGLKKIEKHVQKIFQQSQRYGRLSKIIYV